MAIMTVCLIQALSVCYEKAESRTCMAPVCGRAASTEFQADVSVWPFQMASMGLIHLNAASVCAGRLWRKVLSTQPSLYQ